MSEGKKAKCKAFDEKACEALGDLLHPEGFAGDPGASDTSAPMRETCTKVMTMAPGIDSTDPDAHDHCIGAKASLLMWGGKVMPGKAQQRKCKADG